VPSHQIALTSFPNIHPTNNYAFADRAFDEITFSPHTILREHYRLSNIQKAPRGMETDKSQATRDQNHDAASLTGSSTTSLACHLFSATYDHR
jgi:hypothetical protein